MEKGIFENRETVIFFVQRSCARKFQYFNDFFFSLFLCLITASLPEWYSKIKSSRKMNYFSTLKTRWTIWRLPQVEFENQVENPLGISMPPIPSFLLLVCLIFQLPKNLLCWFSSICFTGQAYRNSSKIIFGVFRTKQPSQVERNGCLL